MKVRFDSRYVSRGVSIVCKYTRLWTSHPGRRAPQTHGNTQSAECLLGKEALGRSKEIFRLGACFCQLLFPSAHFARNGNCFRCGEPLEYFERHTGHSNQENRRDAVGRGHAFSKTKHVRADKLNRCTLML